MEPEKFDRIVRNRMASIKQILHAKGREYADGCSDRLHNFKRAAVMLQCAPEGALQGMLAKHLVSIMDMVDGVEAGREYPIAIWEEKIGDAINYLILLEAIVKEDK